MNTKRQNRKRLTLEQMKVVCEAAEKDWSQAVVEVFRCFDVDLASDDCPQISPSDYAIPNEQWETIAKACLDSPGNEIGKVNHMFDWMNYGPSGYEGLPVGTTCGLHGLPTDTGYCEACDRMNEGVPKEWTE